MEENNGTQIVKQEEAPPVVFDGMRGQIIELKQSIDEKHWELAQLLYNVFEAKTHKEWGFETFDDYVESDLRLSKRMGRYLAKNYKWFVIDNPALADAVKGLSWWQLKELVGIEEPEEVKALAEKARDSKAREFVDHMKEYRRDQSSQPANVEVITTQTLTFKIPTEDARHIEEALKVAQNITNSPRSNALKYMAHEFMASYEANEGDINITDALSKMERLCNVRLVAIDHESRAFIYGHDVVKEIMGEDNAGKDE